jgi:hypothetical protein
MQQKKLVPDEGQRRIVEHGSGPLLACRADSDLAVPAAVPRVAWRAGIDLNPLDGATTTRWPGWSISSGPSSGSDSSDCAQRYLYSRSR